MKSCEPDERLPPRHVLVTNHTGEVWVAPVGVRVVDPVTAEIDSRTAVRWKPR